MAFQSLPKLLLGLACLGGTASADTIYSTFGPGDSYDGHRLQYIGDGAPLGESFLNRQVTNPFTVSSDAELIGYRVAVSHFALTGQGQGMLSLWSGDTEPTTPLESEILFDTGVGTAMIASVSSLLHPLLTPGNTYWLVLGAPQGELFRWYDSEMTIPAGSRPLYRDDSLAGWNSAGTLANAFAVDGRTSEIPEPSTWLLLASGLVFTTLTRSMRKLR